MQRDESLRNSRAKELDFTETGELLKQTKRNPLNAADSRTEQILEKLARQARSLLIKSPQAGLRRAIFNLKIWADTRIIYSAIAERSKNALPKAAGYLPTFLGG